MKPKYRRIAKAIPAIVTLVMSSVAVTNAAVITDTDGAIIIDTTNDGANSAFADGGATPTVDVLTGAVITGDTTVPSDYVIQTTGLDAYTITNNGTVAAIAGYTGVVVNSATGTVINNNGEITAVDQNAVQINIDGATVNNSGTITGGTFSTAIAGQDYLTVENLADATIEGGEGISGFNGLNVTNAGDIIGNQFDGIYAFDNGSVTNTGTITGQDDGIELSNANTVINSGEITGTTGYGIYLEDNNTVENQLNGEITGEYGIYADDDLTLTNAGIITGTNDAGVYAYWDADINNSGDITGLDYGIEVDDDAEIVNSGTITGTDYYGIYADSDLYLENLETGVISGGEEGVDASDDAEIINAGLIEGEFYGVYGSDELMIDNSGTIRASGGDAIYADEFADITNSGTIESLAVGDGIILTSGVVTNSGSILSAADDGIDVDGFIGDTFVLNNTGLIEGAVFSVNGSDADETLNLGLGSNLVGDIDLGIGVDTINFREGFSPFSGGLDNVVDGDILNVDTINKDMIGEATINGLVNADEININEGGLVINGDVFAADGLGQSTINTASGAYFGGTGTLNATLNIEGEFSAAGDAVGEITVNGDVNHGADSYIRFDVIPATAIVNGVNSDLITQTGVLNTYNLNGAGVQIAPTSTDAPISSGVYTVVTTEGTVNGPVGPLSVLVDGLDYNDVLLVTDFSELAITPDMQNLTLTVDRDFTDVAGLGDNDFARALDESLNVADPDLQAFIARLDYSTLDEVVDLFDAVTTLESFSTAAAIISSNYQTNRVVQDHLAMTRSQSGETIIETAPAMTDAKGGMIPAQTTTTGGSSNRFNVWGSFSYDWRDSSGFGSTDIDGEEASFLAGIDYRFAPNFLMGILIEGSRADYDYVGGGSDIDTLRGAIYGTYGQATGFYADFLLGYGDHSVDANSVFGGFNTDTDAESLTAMLTVGYAMQSGSVKHGPWGGIEYSQVDVDGYNAGGILPITVGDYDVESTRLLIGYRLEAQAGRFTPYASVAYAHEINDDNVSAIGTLPGGATFGVNGGSLDSAFLFSVGTGISLTESLSMNVGYHGEIATDDGIDSHGATIGLNYAF